MNDVLRGCGAFATCVVTCACSAIPIAFVFYMGIYAFENPDSEAWLGLESKDHPSLYSSETVAKTAKAT